MAMKIIASRNEGMKDGKNYLRAELIADSASDLSIEGMSNYHFTFGSIAYCIAEKSFYVLNSSGTWVSSSKDSASTLSTTSLNRPSGLMSTKPVTLSPDVTESDTSDSEGITDDDTEDVEELPEEESNEVTEDVEPLRNTESE
jgi:hypothetical protein